MPKPSDDQLGLFGEPEQPEFVEPRSAIDDDVERAPRRRKPKPAAGLKIPPPVAGPMTEEEFVDALDRVYAPPKPAHREARAQLPALPEDGIGPDTATIVYVGGPLKGLRLADTGDYLQRYEAGDDVVGLYARHPARGASHLAAFVHLHAADFPDAPAGLPCPVCPDGRTFVDHGRVFCTSKLCVKHVAEIR